MTKAKTLFLAWQDAEKRRNWFPVGRLDVDEPGSVFAFRYVEGANRARVEADFPPLLDFPDLARRYESAELFPLFKNRVITPGRPDFADYLHQLDLPEHADPIEILSVDGGYRATDAFEVFPRIERRADGGFRCRFFLHGLRHLNSAAAERLDRLEPKEKLFVTIELTNPATQTALQLQSTDYFMIGWAPRYLVAPLMKAIAGAPGNYKAEVVRINPVPAPSKQRLLVEMRGSWPAEDPMSVGDFVPLSE